MKESGLKEMCRDYYRVEKAIEYLETHFMEQPSLKAIADHVLLSEYHFQRLFSRWVGISPKRFLQYLTKEYAKTLLLNSHTVLDTALDAGLSGTGRLHDLFITLEAMTPGTIGQSGRGVTIHYGFHPSPFGEYLVATTEKGVCYLSFIKGEGQKGCVAGLKKAWPFATLIQSAEKTWGIARKIFTVSQIDESAPLHLYVKGTNFQIKVWEALLKIPLGACVTYQDIAQHLKMPNAYRAVGNAVGKNPIPFLIPCHRVIRKYGEFGNYGEGPIRKKAILGWEAARVEENPVDK